ncbi:MAG: class I SAM-dependent methyltransferase [Armatimonadia bacterium]
MPDRGSCGEFISVCCPACGGQETTVRWETSLNGDPGSHLEAFFRCTNTQYGRFGRIVRCRACGMMYRNPQEANLVDAYAAAVDEDYLQEWPARRETFRRSLRQLHRYAQPPGDLLDVGCSTGFFLQVAQEAGWQAVGLEPSHWAVEQARAQGLEVREGDLEANPPPPASFDVVTLWDVIEHVRDPLQTLQAAHAALRPGGVLALTTMDIGSLAARALGSRWPHLMRMHLWYFRYHHVAKLLQEAGFTDLHRHGHVRVLSASYLASRFKFTGGPVSRALGWLIQALGLGKVLVPIYLGDLIAVYARKPLDAAPD